MGVYANSERLNTSSKSGITAAHAVKIKNKQQIKQTNTHRQNES